MGRLFAGVGSDGGAGAAVLDAMEGDDLRASIDRVRHGNGYLFNPATKCHCSAFAEGEVRS